MAKKGQVTDIASAEKKLRQAEFFLWWLEHGSQRVPPDYGNLSYHVIHESVEFYFSACLSAAQSVFYILDKAGGQTFKDIQHTWRTSLPNDSARAQFNRMVTLRDNDVHYGKTDAIPQQKFIPDKNSLTHQRNALLYGWDTVAEMTNPDGTVVRGPSLRGTVGLYLDREGKRVEASSACHDFIVQLRFLLEATKAALP